MEWREFHCKKAGKVHVWRIRNLGEEYETEHGQLNGAFQSFKDSPTSKGKVGTKAFLSAQENTAFHISREIRKKEEHGYLEVDKEGNSVTEQVNCISWDTVIPKHFSGYKPKTNIEPKALEKLYKTGKARFTRKIDGQCHLAVHHIWGWEIYSRRIDLATDRFPLHIQYLEKSGLDVGTIIIGEMICLKGPKENFKDVSRVCRSLPEETRKLITDREVAEPKYVIFDMLFHNKQDLKNLCYDDRAKLWKKFTALSEAEDWEIICRIDYYDLTPDNWEVRAKKENWEGFVVVDGSSVPGDKFYSFDGSAKRPLGHHKLKPIITEDVVVIAASKGTGKRLNGVGALHVAQRHPDTDKFFYAGKIGSGMDDESLVELEKMINKNGMLILDNDKDVSKLDLEKINGFVIEIEYSERMPKTNKFRFPVFLRIRNDKGCEECYAQQLSDEE